MLVGEEASILAVSDGGNVAILDSSQDHKRIFDNDEGPNTGGMGAYSPAPVITPELMEQIKQEVVLPTINGMKAEGAFYQGVLYAGIMVTETGPKVLEFNVRFGDPETQAVLVRLKTDIVELMLKSLEQKLEGFNLEWDDRVSVCVVTSSGGYPGSYEKGKVICGLTLVDDPENVVIFHAGTKKEGGDILTNGGRVLGVTGLGHGISEAIARTYAAVEKVDFEHMFYRKDIGRRALDRIKH